VNFERESIPDSQYICPLNIGKPADQQAPSAAQEISAKALILYIFEEIELGQELSLNLFFDSNLGFESIEARMQVVWKDFCFEKRAAAGLV